MFYIVGTPLGNVEDISLRAVETLISADVILSEDTRSFPRFYERIQELYKIYPAKQQEILSFHDQNEFERMPSIIEKLKKGLDVALVSESGMPLISDPGSLLLQKIQAAEIPFTVIPGPTAFATAAILSGFPTKNMLFIGFLSKKPNQVLQLFNQLKQAAAQMKDLVVIFYESPYRIQSTLKVASSALPDAKIVICREMTKKFEEVIRGKPSELMEKEFKGEITVVMQL